ncbi:FAD:protein FMN transferase [Oceanisphaera psychrotolerans]|uniref:FAD:protein FMN transferase n=1 Tax=Oceanisphaera psychrotolerans TaxID=1414654 RepID=A0A1J4QIP9_9GAMM|nr:FAD:protein FMN transferase [Oceanisphaera psychrotolerans]OIN13797.1 FAD:protein FMN transferase ApbE [Oceanisphaera psychrotolerans]
MMSYVTKWLAPLGLAFLLVACKPATVEHPQLHLTGNTMGTYYSVKVVGAEESRAQVLQAEIDRRLERVNEQMSTYREDSELSRFNRFGEPTPFRVSADTARVVTAALQLGRMTEGALDVTVGPLVNLWGFGPDARPTRVPSLQQLAQIRERTGLQHLRVTVDSEAEYLYKQLPELAVDLSAIAKGFGVDVVSEYLAEQGLTDHLVEIGGEVRLSGLNAHGQPWRIAVEKPETGSGSVQQVIAIGNSSVATSGDYRNYYELDGQRLSHTIDPQTGRPITHQLASVTVIHPSCMIADGLATALTVMGTERALVFAEQHQLAVYLLTKTDEGFRVDMTSAFKKYLRG